MGGGKEKNLLIIRGTEGKWRGAVPTRLNLPWLFGRSQNSFEVINSHTLFAVDEGRSNTRPKSGDNFRSEDCEEVIFAESRNGVSTVSREPISDYKVVINEAVGGR